MQHASTPKGLDHQARGLFTREVLLPGDEVAVAYPEPPPQAACHPARPDRLCTEAARDPAVLEWAYRRSVKVARG